MFIKRLFCLFLLLVLPTFAMQQIHMQRGLQSLLMPRIQKQHDVVWKGSSKPWTSKTFKYDDILTLLADLESGALERGSTDQDLEQINYFLADLAREGLIPNCNDPYELEQDIEELLGISDPHSFRYAPAERSSYELTPAIYYGGYETQTCGWFSKAWKNTKKFCKKHKKAIIIGAVVVVVATVIVVAVVAAPAAGGGAAAAGAAGGAAEGGGAAGGLAAGGAAVGAAASAKSDDENPSTTAGVNQAVASRPDASPPKGPSGGGKSKSPPPKIEEIVERQCSNFKEAVAEERPVVNHDKPEMRLPFQEATRLHGALAAREAVTEVMESLGAVGPESQNQSLAEVDGAFSVDSASIAPVGAALAVSRIPGGPAVKATAAVGAMAAVTAFPEETQKAYNAISDGLGYVCDKAVECVRGAGEYVQEWVTSRNQHEPTVYLEVQGNFQDDRILQSPEEYFEGFPDRVLPRDSRTNEPVGDVNVPHTQLGTRDSNRTGKYKQAREFDESGKDVKRADFTDHNDPVKHPNPHQHRVEPNETGGTKKISPAEPLTAD